MTDLVLVGRSSSHFTRLTRIFALELGVAHTFRAVLDLTSADPASYAGNPALKIPVLVDADGPIFGAENICRELTQRAQARARVVLRGDVAGRLVANAEEMTLHAMATDVALVMASVAAADRPAPPKRRPSLERALVYLDEHIDRVCAALPADRRLSFVEAALFCVVTHLPFRHVLDVAPYERLAAFCAGFGQRESAQRTEYRYDAAS
jgi:glutathione S-transferase